MINLNEALNSAINAISTKDLETFATLLEKTPAILEQRNRDGLTPALIATQQGALDIFKLCVEKEPSVLDQKDIFGNTPALLAAADGQTELFKFIVRQRRNVLAQTNEYGRSPENVAVYYGHKDILELCIKASTLPDYSDLLLPTDSTGYKPVFAAIELNRLECLKVIIQYYPSVTRCIPIHERDSAATFAARMGYTDALKMLIEADPEVLYLQIERQNGVTRTYSSRGWQSYERQKNTRILLLHEPDMPRSPTPALVAAAHGRTKALTLCIEASPGVLNQTNAQGDTPALVAAKNGHTEAFKRCLDASLNVLNQTDAQGLTPAMIAASKGYVDILAACLDADKNELLRRSSEGDTLAHCAAKHNQPAALTVCVDRDSSILETRNTALDTPVLCAARQGHIDILKLFEHENSVILSQTDKDERTMAMIAALQGHTEMLSFCLDTDSDALNKTDNVGNTVAHWAARNLDGATLQLCINKDRSVLIKQNHVGDTPVHFSVTANNIRAFELCLGENLTAHYKQCNCGFTPTYLAAYCKNHEMLQLSIRKDSMLLTLPDKKGNTVAHLAARKWDIEILQLCCEAVPELLTTPNDEGFTPPMMAARLGNVDMLSYCINKNRDVLLDKTPDGKTLAHIAVYYGQADILELCCEQQQNALQQADNEGRTPVMYIAIRNSGLKLRDYEQYLNSAVMTVQDKSSRTALVHAVENNIPGNFDTDNVEYCLTFEVPSTDDQVNENVLKAFHIALEQENVSIVKLCVEKAPDVLECKTAEGDLPIMVAIQNHELLKYMSSVRPELLLLKDRTGMTPVRLAALYNDLEAVKIGIAANSAVLNQLDTNDDTLANWAITMGNIELLEACLKASPNTLEIKDKEGATPAVKAAQQLQLDALRLCIFYNPDVLNDLDINGRSVVDILAAHVHFNCSQSMQLTKPHQHDPSHERQQQAFLTMSNTLNTFDKSDQPLAIKSLLLAHNYFEHPFNMKAQQAFKQQLTSLLYHARLKNLGIGLMAVGFVVGVCPLTLAVAPATFAMAMTQATIVQTFIQAHITLFCITSMVTFQAGCALHFFNNERANLFNELNSASKTLN